METHGLPDGLKITDNFYSIKNMSETSKLDKIVSLCKRRGFVIPGSDIYGGLANSWDYGHVGNELFNNIASL